MPRFQDLPSQNNKKKRGASPTPEASPDEASAVKAGGPESLRWDCLPKITTGNYQSLAYAFRESVKKRLEAARNSEVERDALQQHVLKIHQERGKLAKTEHRSKGDLMAGAQKDVEKWHRGKRLESLKDAGAQHEQKVEDVRARKWQSDLDYFHSTESMVVEKEIRHSHALEVARMKQWLVAIALIQLPQQLGKLVAAAKAQQQSDEERFIKERRRRRVPRPQCLAFYMLKEQDEMAMSLARRPASVESICAFVRAAGWLVILKRRIRRRKATKLIKMALRAQQSADWFPAAVRLFMMRVKVAQRMARKYVTVALARRKLLLLQATQTWFKVKEDLLNKMVPIVKENCGLRAAPRLTSGPNSLAGSMMATSVNMAGSLRKRSVARSRISPPDSSPSSPKIISPIGSPKSVITRPIGSPKSVITRPNFEASKLASSFLSASIMSTNSSHQEVTTPLTVQETKKSNRNSPDPRRRGSTMKSDRERRGSTGTPTPAAASASHHITSGVFKTLKQHHITTVAELQPPADELHSLVRNHFFRIRVERAMANHQLKADVDEYKRHKEVLERAVVLAQNSTETVVLPSLTRSVSYSSGFEKESNPCKRLRDLAPVKIPFRPNLADSDVIVGQMEDLLREAIRRKNVVSGGPLGELVETTVARTVAVEWCKRRVGEYFTKTINRIHEHKKEVKARKLAEQGDEDDERTTLLDNVGSRLQEIFMSGGLRRKPSVALPKTGLQRTTSLLSKATRASPRSSKLLSPTAKGSVGKGLPTTQQRRGEVVKATARRKSMLPPRGN